MLRHPSQLQETLAVLAAPRRFDLLLLMLSGADRSVSQLAEAVGLSQSCTTRHLQALARAGLVKGVRDGKRVVFRIAPRDAAAQAVLASVSGRAAAAPAPRREGPGETGRALRRRARPEEKRRAPRRRTASVGGAIPRRVLDAAIRIESSAELEPYMAHESRAADGADGVADPRAGTRPDPESGRTSEPEALPAWRRSDLEDFLL